MCKGTAETPSANSSETFPKINPKTNETSVCIGVEELVRRAEGAALL